MVKYIIISILLMACTSSEYAQQNAAPQATDTTKIETERQLPLLHIQPQVYVLGDIKEGEAAIATFLLRNNSKKTIELVDIQASCGCTAAEPDSYIISPGEFTQLKVAVDTTAKQNDIKKSIYITDSSGHKASATLEFNVVKNPHLMQGVDVKGIFDGQCASCHFQPLVGETSAKKLYEVGCAMCHGADAEGAYAPSLRGYASLAALKHIVAAGVGKPQMPGFGEKNGGPLTVQQIDNLSEWLMTLPKK